MQRFLFLICLISTGALFGAPDYSAPNGNALATLRNEVKNHEEELQTLNERLRNQEATLELLREQLEENKKEIGTSGIQRTESTISTVVADLQKLRNNANQLADAVGKTDKRLSQLEETIDSQNHNISNIQAALKSILDAFDMKDPLSGSGTYKVQAGDSLEKVAKKLNTSVKKLKELNNLKKDQIRVGQTLKVP